jgi:hypothetical protein
MKALTVYQPWASLIAGGMKPYEFRRWAAPRAIVGQRIAIHAGARKMRNAEIADLLNRLESGGKGTGLRVGPSLDLLQQVWRERAFLPHSSVLCTAVLGEPRKASVLFGRDMADSDRIDHSIWAWPLTDVQVLEPYQPARGAQGFWEWAPSAQEVAA